MFASAMFGAQALSLRNPPSTALLLGPSGGVVRIEAPRHVGGLVIECSSRPQKKATAHHRKTRPRKTQPWDVKRKPTVYPPLPPLPPEWTLLSHDHSSSASAAVEVSVIPPPEAQPATPSG
ncbi:large ribosomal subunit protein cL38 [Ziziphus jujuba]|uniref:Large ribosomal subunit protein cL38 n=2 Tax=Ziziphus jujuba TaxID=326968 RepID=A0A6P3Z3E9_ZIZJJ|nr:large ribosomal subunit protein cL38 [Ziziphus jujuba]KAH7524848.1 hypothetical protein FEM48_Zijuj06G0162500 [Ziziphus jujuba var. spinosa]